LSGLFPRLPDETRKALYRLQGIIDETFPLKARFRAALPKDIAELSRLLTFERTERDGSYLGRPALLSAYLRYYLPWNIYRLSRLFTGLPLDLKPNDTVNDFGAGPLTLAAALWISRPELRDIPLEFRCLDRTTAALDAGRKLFAALTAKTACPWTVKTIRGELRAKSLSVEIRGKPAALSAVINVYNELFWNFSPMDTEGLALFARNQARLLSSLTGGSVLVVEPGIPRSGEFISILRSFLMEEGRDPVSPCPHSGPCSFPGGRAAGGHGKAKWCHFAFGVEDAPEELHLLSAAARLPKEKAALSFILSGPIAQKTGKNERLPFGINSEGAAKIRVISDCFPVDSPEEKNSHGRYGCCKSGIVLVTGSRKGMDSCPSGALEELAIIGGAFDPKSGARIARIKR